MTTIVRSRQQVSTLLNCLRPFSTAGAILLACHAIARSGELLPEVRYSETAEAVPSPAAPDLNSPSNLQLVLRNYAENLHVSQGHDRHAWVQSVQIKAVSAYTAGAVGLGADFSLFAAGKLDGGTGARNMVHVSADGMGQDRHLWVFPGSYVAKARWNGGGVRYGLQAPDTPFLHGFNNRSLPPMFKGWMFEQALNEQLRLQANSFDAVLARGNTELSTMQTSYGGVAVTRISDLGAEWQYAPEGKVSAYLSRAHDVWQQIHLSSSASKGDASHAKWGHEVNLYLTRDQGRGLQGRIENMAYSTTVSAHRRGVTLELSYQHILGDQFYDFIDETTGTRLANSNGADYNAPHEKSLQVQLTLDQTVLPFAGLQIHSWWIGGSGADASVEAARHAVPGSLHNLYWKNGVPAHGGHQEAGLKFAYKVQGQRLRNSSIALVLIGHRVTPEYPAKAFRDIALRIDIPVRL